MKKHGGSSPVPKALSMMIPNRGLQGKEEIVKSGFNACALDKAFELRSERASEMGIESLQRRIVANFTDDEYYLQAFVLLLAFKISLTVQRYRMGLS